MLCTGGCIVISPTHTICIHETRKHKPEKSANETLLMKPTHTHPHDRKKEHLQQMWTAIKHNINYIDVQQQLSSAAVTTKIPCHNTFFPRYTRLFSHCLSTRVGIAFPARAKTNWRERESEIHFLNGCIWINYEAHFFAFFLCSSVIPSPSPPSSCFAPCAFILVTNFAFFMIKITYWQERFWRLFAVLF